MKIIDEPVISDVYKYVKNKLQTTEEGSTEYDALKDVCDYIKHSMNIEYGKLNNDKKLISQDALFDIIKNYISSDLNKCVDSPGAWCEHYHINWFYWVSCIHAEQLGRSIGCGLRGDHWVIWNYRPKNKNIKVYSDHVVFNMDSEFKDYDMGWMYKLYLIIKEVVEGNNLKEENICSEA